MSDPATKPDPTWLEWYEQAVAFHAKHAKVGVHIERIEFSGGRSISFGRPQAQQQQGAKK